MRFPIDLVGLDAAGMVVDRVAGMKPWRLRLPRQGVVGVLELAKGSLDRSDTRLGHCLTFEAVGVRAATTPVANDASLSQGDEVLTQDTSPKAVTTAVPEPPIVPERPTSLAEVGLTPDSVAALMLKWLYAGKPAAPIWPTASVSRTRCSKGSSSTLGSSGWWRCAALAVRERRDIATG